MPERNEPCPCGSGKKYKKCCIDRYVGPTRAPKEPSKPKTKWKPGFNQEKVNAYHEAGHAVVGALEGPGTDITTIDRETVLKESGQSMHGYTAFIGVGKVKINLDTYLGMTLAGVTSESMYATNGVISAKEQDISDALAILDRAGYIDKVKKENKFLDARVRTEELISKYKREIQIVGDALYQRKTLRANDIRELLGVNGKEQQKESTGSVDKPAI